MIPSVDIRIGEEIYYIAEAAVLTSPVVGASVQSLTPEETGESGYEVILALESGLRIPHDRACRSEEELYKQLSRDFKATR